MEKPNFYKEYGSAIGLPCNAIAYELTNGGENLPESVETLIKMVRAKMEDYSGLHAGNYEEISRYMLVWWKNAQTK